MTTMTFDMRNALQNAYHLALFAAGDDRACVGVGIEGTPRERALKALARAHSWAYAAGLPGPACPRLPTTLKGIRAAGRRLADALDAYGVSEGVDAFTGYATL